MTIQLHVRSLCGHIASLPVDTSWTALDVKQALETIVNVPAGEVHLFKETLELLNTDVLGTFRGSEGDAHAMELSWLQATPWPCFGLDEVSVREAEEAATRFVSLGPLANSYIEAQRTMMQPNGTGPLGAMVSGPLGAMAYGTGAPCMGAMPGYGLLPGLGGVSGGDIGPDGTNVGATGMLPAGYGGGPGGWALQAGPADLGWSDTAGAGTAPCPSAPVFGAAHGNGHVPQLPPLGEVAPSAGPNSRMGPASSMPGSTEFWNPHAEESAQLAQCSPPAVVAAPPVLPIIAVPEPLAPATQEAPPAATASGISTEAPTSIGGEAVPSALLETAADATQQPSLPSPSTPGSTAASPVAGASPSNAIVGDHVNPNRAWANIVTKDKEAKERAETDAAGREASSSSAAPATRKEEDGRPRNSIVDFLLLLAQKKHDGADQNELPEELRKFKQATEAGVSTNGKAKYNRRGMKNDANNCYVNVVIQSLLPCSALMQLLSNCAADSDRPFYTAMLRLCKEFHSRKEVNDSLNVLNLPQVKQIISMWQQLGAQQDAGEFLFHVLTGLHEECKWKTAPEEDSPTADGKTPGADDGASGEAAQVRPDVRSAGQHEDSPVFRIFGGIIRSSVLAKNAKADSVSLEPFNGLILDISSSSVDSVWSALEAYCGTEAVDEGRATKRLQFKAVPKVLILNLKRFSYNKDTGMPQKIRKAVKFEEKLTFDGSWLVDDVEPQEYQLTAVICHHGELVSGGHYNCAVRYNSDWYMYDDVSVRQMGIREVVSQLTMSVYLLLYQCNDRIDVRP